MAVFAGQVPETYDRFMGPIFFEPYAEDLDARLPHDPSLRVLELACGTGILTRRLRDRRLVATDLNPPMLARAAAKLPDVDFRQADALHLPFDDASFDAVVCQFGAMFFPDKVAAFREARRVLAPGGVFLFNVWGSLDDNLLSKDVAGVIASFFPSNPTNFYDLPFGYHDGDAIAAALAEAGFDAKVERVVRPSGPTSARDAAVALVQGSPIVDQIAARGGDVERITDAAEQAIRERFGDPVQSTMTALVCTCRLPS
jgi:SAM-dependent methyltransferase